MDKETLSASEIERIAALVSAKRAPDLSLARESLPCEVTAVVYVYNCICTLALAMRSVEPGAQSVPVKLIVADNGSRDGTQAFVRDLASDSVTRNHWLSRGFRDIRCISVPHNESHAGLPGKLWNMRECLRETTKLIDTEYTFSFDADVETPSGALRTMLDALKEHPRLGAVGIQYDDSVDHVEHGCTMRRTDALRKAVVEMTFTDCPCRQIHRHIEGQGLLVRHLPPLSARHMKLEV
jgi:glycosyltransferase involved in cell wall biosynthesis